MADPPSVPTAPPRPAGPPQGAWGGADSPAALDPALSSSSGSGPGPTRSEGVKPTLASRTPVTARGEGEPTTTPRDRTAVPAGREGLQEAVPAAAAVAPPAPASAAISPSLPSPAPRASSRPSAADSGQRAAAVSETSLAPPVFPVLRTAAGGAAEDLTTLLDVPLEVTVELGRTQCYVRDVLALVPGSVLALQRLAGEPVDVLANGRRIARGEVVVVDESFGVRITEVPATDEGRAG